MTIKQYGGVFGRNPTFNNVTIDGTLSGLSNLPLSGNLVLASGQGIDFSATSGTGTSELFDDYEEGTWTPTLTTSGTDFDSVTYDTGLTAGYYTKVGNCVTFQMTLRTNAVTVGSASGSVRIGGLPFSSASGNQRTSAAFIGQAEAWAGETPIAAQVLHAGTEMALFYRATSDAATSGTAIADVATGSADNLIRVSGLYYTS